MVLPCISVVDGEFIKNVNSISKSASIDYIPGDNGCNTKSQWWLNVYFESKKAFLQLKTFFPHFDLSNTLDLVASTNVKLDNATVAALKVSVGDPRGPGCIGHRVIL